MADEGFELTGHSQRRSGLCHSIQSCWGGQTAFSGSSLFNNHEETLAFIDDNLGRGSKSGERRSSSFTPCTILGSYGSSGSMECSRGL